MNEELFKIELVDLSNIHPAFDLLGGRDGDGLALSPSVGDANLRISRSFRGYFFSNLRRERFVDPVKGLDSSPRLDVTMAFARPP